MTKKKTEKKQFLILLFIVFLGFLGISIPYLIFPALFLNPHLSILPASWESAERSLFLGITLAAYPLGQFIGSPILGSLSDDYGRKKFLSATLFGAALCHVMTGFAITWQNLNLLIISRFAAGIMEGNIAIARAMAADLKTLSKHETFGKINAAASIAFLVGPLLGAVITEMDFFHDLTISAPFYLTSILFIFVGALSIAVLKSDIVIKNSSQQSFYERINLFKRLRELFKNKNLKFLMLVSTGFTLAVDIFYEFGPVYLTLKWTLEPAQLIIYNAVLCIGLALGNGWLASFMASRVSSRTTIKRSIGGFVFLLVGMIGTNSPLMMISLFTLCGILIGLAVTLITVKISNTVSDKIQGEVMGSQISLRVLGDAVICLLGGALLMISPKLILAASAMLAALALVYYMLKTKKLNNT